MNTFILIDVHNLFHRAKFTTHGDISLKTGMAVNTMFNSLRKIWKMFEGTHIVLCTDHKSWRYAYYPEYKRARHIKRDNLSQKDQDEEQLLKEALDSFLDFCEKRTNATVIKQKGLEADDIISKWIEKHPNDYHIILSGDTDFIQLLSDNVIMYDGARERTIKIDGYYDKNDQLMYKSVGKNKKQVAQIPKEPEYELFLKCIRGDSSDGIFSSYPGVRETKIQKAYKDRHTQLEDWNNFMLHEWYDSNDKKHRVLDDYNFNKLLIDLKNQPDDIQQLLNETIESLLHKKNNKNVGVWFLTFCEEWDLQRHKNNPETIARILQTNYPN